MGKTDHTQDHDLDQVDRAILRILQEDAMVPNARLAERLSLSLTPCWRRLKRLEQEGYIDGYRAILNRRKLGLGVMVFVQLTFAIHSDDSSGRFEEAILQVPEVLFCYKVTGTADYLLQIVAQDLDAYGEFVEKVLRKIPGVTTIQSSVTLRQVKASTQLPVD